MCFWRSEEASYIKKTVWLKGETGRFELGLRRCGKGGFGLKELESAESLNFWYQK
ncbi:hypothetical protein NUZ5A_51112 [Candidatus Nitrosotenuis uzonensis]|uniref:Uncharacterized protein n=1 Tax=Candidatus Nitrosotenuis uzonensis TaxID=1407055 RepID=A0A812F3T5_9ARCH|nr:hypothetical protein NUZ5A_51112 [Candidatus Nitrosotenuis uzonensis]